MTEATRVFVRKSSKIVQNMKDALDELPSDQNPAKVVADIQCSVQIIRGAAGFLKLAPLESVATAGEEYLYAVRGGSVRLGPGCYRLLNQLTDALGDMLRQLESSRHDTNNRHLELLCELRRQSRLGAQPESTADEPSAVGTRPTSAARRSDRRALVIDDSMALRRVLRRVMQDLSFEVSEASSAEQGLEWLQGCDKLPNVILVDWMLPEMNGVEFIQKVRSVTRYRSIPLMMVTSERHPDARERAQKAGVDQYITKPFTREDVIQGIENLGLLN